MKLTVAILAAFMTLQPERDAAQAFKDRYQTLLLEGQNQEGPNAYELIPKVASSLDDLGRRIVKQSYPDLDPEDVDHCAITREGTTDDEKSLARAVVAAARSGELASMVAQLANAHRFVPPLERSVLVSGNRPWVEQAKKLARFQLGRMTVAQEQGDFTEWMKVFNETMQIGGLVSREPSALAWLMGVSIQAVAIDGAQRLLTCDGIDDALCSQLMDAITSAPTPDFDRALLVGERIIAEDVVDYVFAFGPDSIDNLTADAPPPRPAKAVTDPGAPLWPDTPDRAATDRAIANAFDAATRLSKKSAAARKESVDLKTIETALEISPLICLALPPIDSLLQTKDQSATERDGLLMLIALERYRLTHGGYPKILLDVQPLLKGHKPRDFYSGKSLGYLPPRTTGYPHGHTFVLYAAGMDGEDSGGKVDFDSPLSANRPGVQGRDVLLNRYARRATP